MAVTTVERLREFRGNDLQELCEAAEEGITAGGGFGWLKPPPRSVMESYWRGVMLIPDRILFVGRLDGVIAGTAQLLRPAKNNEAQARTARMTTHFVRPGRAATGWRAASCWRSRRRRARPTPWSSTWTCGPARRRPSSSTSPSATSTGAPIR